MQTSCTTTNNYTSSSSSPSSPSHSSSITHHSAIASSTASSSSSSSFFPSSSPSSSSSRCIGLNLLVKAIHQVTAGSIIGVPYIQHRIVTRRKRPIHFNNLIITATTTSKKISKPKGKRHSAMPSKYKDSVLHPKRRSERISSSSSRKQAPKIQATMHRGISCYIQECEKMQRSSQIATKTIYTQRYSS